MRLRLFILALAAAIVASASEVSMTVECGTWVEISAKALPDYHFVKWSDGNTDSVRQIQVNDNLTFVAYFGINCGSYANLPVVERYDWLFMLNVKAVREMGYNVQPEYITWYRVVGEPDDLEGDPALWDDEPICKGYSLSIDQNFTGTGDYYCIADFSSTTTGQLCEGIMRSMIISYSTLGEEKEQKALRLLPTLAYAGQTQKLEGLNPNVESEVYIYSSSGQQIDYFISFGEEERFLEAAWMIGCYQVVVREGEEKTVLRYVVK